MPFRVESAAHARTTLNNPEDTVCYDSILIGTCRLDIASFAAAALLARQNSGGLRRPLWNFISSAGDMITLRAIATRGSNRILYLNGTDSIEFDFAGEDLTIGPLDDEE